MTKNIYIPQGFDARTHLPERLWKHADAANYLLHTIEWNRVCYRRRRCDYIPLKAAYLNNTMGRWVAKDIRTALAAEEIIDIDPQYFPGEKSRGYRLGSKLRDATFRRQTITAKLAKKLKNHKMYKKPRLPIHKYLYSWLTRLEVDHQAAMRSLQTGDELIDKYIPLDMIADRQFYMVPDDYGRLHTNVSSLARTLRPFLHYGDDKLVLLDLKNSQPFFFSLLLLNYYANDRSINSFYTYNKSDKKKGRRGSGAAITIDILSMLNHNSLVKLDLPRDVKDYISLTETGKLYEELVTVFDARDREEAKTALFQWVLFCKPRKNKFHSLFRNRFPSVSEVIDALKEREYRRLSHHLQKCESAAMIHGVCGRLRDDFPDVPVWTIHDCVMTTKPFLEPVRTVVRDQFAAMSLKPTISEQDFTLAA